jgi:hypothetical protein
VLNTLGGASSLATGRFYFTYFENIRLQEVQFSQENVSINKIGGFAGSCGFCS